MTEEQTSFRLPTALARALARESRARGVTKSQVVREALEQYLAERQPAARATSVRERSAPYIGAVKLDATAIGSDDVASMIRRHNWRD